MTNPPRRIDRKQFLKWTLSSSSALALGCSPAPEDSTRGNGGTSGSGGTAAGSGGTSANAGTGGSTVGGGGSGGGGLGGGGASGSGGGGTSGGGGSGGGVPVTPDCNAHIGVFVTADHGHVLPVTIADITAAVDKVYDTTGTADHPHFIQLTAADFAKLQAGGTVRKLTCNDGHEHEYIVNCTGAVPTTTSGAVAFCDPAHSCADTNTNFCPELPELP